MRLLILSTSTWYTANRQVQITDFPFSHSLLTYSSSEAGKYILYKGKKMDC